ncbi:hypothetical protein SAMN04487992_11920 [Cellulophaga baltica]|uniref:Uncharacterized protein n=1 Tax=Cellulophaga baltica TaxID=76594 RepID=A0A1G7LLI8_9FLAO|nr:hypothetical protein SAMN04487992_11920 [Cellulophaga baltica]
MCNLNNMINDGLYILTNSLCNTHLGLAVDSLYRSRTEDRRRKSPISTITHSYFSLESAINFLGYEIFFNEDSTKYIPDIERDFPLKRMLKG